MVFNITFELANWETRPLNLLCLLWNTPVESILHDICVCASDKSWSLNPNFRYPQFYLQHSHILSLEENLDLLCPWIVLFLRNYIFRTMIDAFAWKCACADRNSILRHLPTIFNGLIIPQGNVYIKLMSWMINNVNTLRVLMEEITHLQVIEQFSIPKSNYQE